MDVQKCRGVDRRSMPTAVNLLAHNVVHKCVHCVQLSRQKNENGERVGKKQIQIEYSAYGVVQITRQNFHWFRCKIEITKFQLIYGSSRKTNTVLCGFHSVICANLFSKLFFRAKNGKLFSLVCHFAIVNLFGSDHLHHHHHHHVPYTTDHTARGKNGSRYAGST